MSLGVHPHLRTTKIASMSGKNSAIFPGIPCTPTHRWAILGLCAIFGVVVQLPLFAEQRQPFSEKPSAAELEFFEKSVRPLLIEHCYECHSADEADGGLALDSRGGARQGGDSGPAIIPGDPDKSLLIDAVRYTNHDLQMPPQNRLRPADVAVLEKWVAGGAVDPRGDAPSGDSVVGSVATGMSVEDGRKFWSFQPVADPPVPAVNRPEWVRTPIDAFVLSRLEQSGLALRRPPSGER